MFSDNKSRYFTQKIANENMDTGFQQLKKSVIEGRNAFRQSEAAKILDSHKKDGSYSAEERKQILDEAHRCLSDMESFLRTDYPSLTDDDIELCLLSALRCKPKACSLCLTVSEEAIRVRKHRLKGKLPREVVSLVWEERSGTHLLKTLFMKDTMQNVWRRFPLTVVYLLLLTIGCILYVWEKIPDKWNSITLAVLFSLFLGLILTSTTTLWGEEVKKKNLRLWVTAIGNLLLVLNAVFISKHIHNEPSAAFFIVQASITTALAAAFFHLPFFREKDDLPLWNFTWRTFLWLCISLATGGVLTGGLFILLNSFSMLFSLSVSEECYLTTGVLSMLFVPALLFLARIPEGEEKHSHVAIISKFLLFAIRYLFVPLLLLYLIVLYTYGLRILINWELPNGGVAWPVTVLMIGCIVVELCLYPFIRSNESGSFEKRIARLLPVLIIPLLLLMTIGTARRLNDYGITPPRLYLLLFNLWCYAVCLGLFFGKAKRIRWIMTSFAACFLLTSALPINLTSLSIRQRRQAFFQLAEGTLPDSLPMDCRSAKEWFGSIEDERVKSGLLNEIRFFRKTDSKALSDMLSSDAIAELSAAPHTEEYVAGEGNASGQVFELWGTDGLPTDIPEGYTKFWKRDVWHKEMSRAEAKGFWIDDLPGTGGATRIFIDWETLKSAQETGTRPRFPSADSSRLFVAESFHIRPEKDSTFHTTSRIEGYVFSK